MLYDVLTESQITERMTVDNISFILLHMIIKNGDDTLEDKQLKTHKHFPISDHNECFVYPS